MKSKLNIKYLFLTFLLIIGFQSCTLDSEIYDAINPSIFPTNKDDASALVTANVYNVFGCSGGMYNSAASDINVVTELMSDYGECAWRQWTPILYGRWLIDNSYTNALYDNYAKYISNMTLTADRIGTLDIDETVKEQYLAELRCGRGWLAFCMYDLFGPIPIADLETLKNPLDEIIIPRMTDSDMINYIETELTTAANVLPYSYKKGDADYGRFTKGLANTVLLKLYMMTKQWGKAETVGRELTKSEYGYDLVPKYKDIFTLENEKNVETIWAVNCLTGYQEHRWLAHVLINDYPFTPSNQVKWGGYKISWPFYHTFEINDERLEVIAAEYTGTGGIIHNETLDVPSGGRLKYGAIPIKYGADPTTNGTSNQIDWIVYRYADVLTLLAEAIVRNNGSITQEAVDLLNRIRLRAGLDAYQLSSFSSTDDFLDKLLLERGHELFFEGTRRQDLIRYGIYVESMKAKCMYAGEVTLINENMTRLPLPTSLINQGKGEIEQNPGY